MAGNDLGLYDRHASDWWDPRSRFAGTLHGVNRWRLAHLRAAWAIDPGNAAVFDALSAQSRWLRFHNGMPRIPERYLTHLARVQPGERQEALKVNLDLDIAVRHAGDDAVLTQGGIAHHVLAGILKDFGIIRTSAESAVESGVSSTFFPHGLGHFLGLQVHDVGGFQRDESGGTIDKPAGHPYLRLTRTLEAGHVVTVEPGIYFIPMLLAKLRASADAAAVDWAQVEAMLPFGGIRIEDDVHVTDGAPENLTRDAFAALAQAG